MDLRAALTESYEKHGKLTPELLVADAKPASHPLHDRFEWNDKIAGAEHRKTQAAELIRSVRVVFSAADPSSEDRSVRAFVAVRKANSESAASTYVPIETLADDDVARQAVLAEAAREWRTFKRKYEHLTEFFAQVATEATDLSA
jgi:hypothetical protein